MVEFLARIRIGLMELRIAGNNNQLAAGIGFVNALPATPSKFFPLGTPSWYRYPSMLSNERFSSMRTTTWSNVSFHCDNPVTGNYEI